MHKFSAIFIATLLTLNIVSSMRLSSIDSSLLPSYSVTGQLTSILLQVKKTEDAKTIKGFLDQIRTLASKLKEDQDKHKEIADSMDSKCKDEEKFRQKEVDDAQKALDKANDAKANCDVSLKSSQKNLPELESALASYTKSLQDATAQRKQENEAYNTRKNDYEEGIKFLSEFIEYVSGKVKDQFSSFSFVEKSEQLLRHTAKLGLIKEAVPILITLAQDTPSAKDYNYKSNQDLGTQLKDTLKELQNRLESDYKENEAQEKKLAAAFAELENKLNAALNTLNSNITTTKEQINRMTTCVTDESAVAAKAGEKLNRNTTLRDSANKMCYDFAKEFVNATNSRLDEIKLIEEILEIVDKKFANVSESLKLYLESVKDGWLKYKNSTEFQGYVDYIHKNIANNESGHNLANKQAI
jgi:DNA repair exonuclease SbcCD ATPase subunit